MRGRPRLPLILGMVVLVPGCRASSASSEHVKMPFPAFFIAMLLGLALGNKHRGKFEIDVGLDTQSNRVSDHRNVKSALFQGDVEFREMDGVTGDCCCTILVVGGEGPH